jgi:hypothetical protein
MDMGLAIISGDNKIELAPLPLEPSMSFVT